MSTVSFQPANEEQRAAIRAYRDSDLLFLLGAAGSGKTFIATALALQDITAPDSTRKKLYLTRPVVEAGEKLGSLPGNVEEKVAPYMVPIKECLSRLAPKGSGVTLNKKMVESAPIAYLRGRTFQDCVAIFDEAQNANWSQLKLFLTRMGTNAKIIVTGDPWQSDLPPGRGLLDAVKMLEDIKGVSVVRFNIDACVRHPLVKEILRRM